CAGSGGVWTLDSW
nr:immunoglobulin heavy chain junction region [Macaca mulatta]MOV86842.1 immunoglobulin heavy chain junction region [Macaca mulatta]MOV87290.1 immunoglobulin heavy chain junction region [Macaca mulatta]MOV87537.1 immunoglobulin heavy chain junction region [Macaca mulatta]MOV87628.1 immunoglobulin heavy chain junction region [Macaca mulatta]